MQWFFIALLNPILHAGTNHLDKYLISKYFKDVQVGSLVIFSGLFSIVAVPFVIFFAHGLPHVSLRDGIILAFNGMLVVIAIMCYLYALNEDEASFVVPLFQFLPILGLVLSFLFLGEVVELPKIIGALIIIGGSLILSFDIQGEKIKFKKKVVFFMFLSSLCYAINIVVFKSIALENGFWQSLFFDLLGKIIFAIVLFSFIGSFRSSFIAVLKTYKLKFVLLSGLNDILTICGDWALAFSALMAPVFFVQIVSTVQPIFVFIFGIMITAFFPNVSKEVLVRKLFLQKLIGIVLVIGGSLLFL